MITLKPHDPIPKALHNQRLDKCVWMASGVVTYKLCDFQYNCEACPFDQAIREGTQSKVSRGYVTDQSKRR